MNDKADDALICLSVIAGTGGMWEQFRKLRTDTRGIVVERAAKEVDAELAALRQQLATARAALAEIEREVTVGINEVSRGRPPSSLIIIARAARRALEEMDAKPEK